MRNLLLVSIVALFGGMIAAVSWVVVEASAGIRVTASGTSSAGATFLGASGAKKAASLGATTAGLGNWAKAAKKACPDGYSIVAGSAQHSLTFKVTKSFGGFWVNVTATYTVSIEIECDKRGKYPAAPKWDSEYGKLTEDDLKKYKNDVAREYSNLQKIKTPEQLIRKVRDNKLRGVDYSEFERAVRNGEFTRVQIPTLEELSNYHIHDGSTERGQ